eukprot:TRINITY_DN3127_c0_g1_i2.p1 TRINITY_DN3127_c0_g1~~TRINITY_DN3127_c0_g1_i2.p1  ORF type:complete len:254 (-),score=29.59 TRINITY_DN3127_c0_g1_i2:159-920(-)
MKEALDSRFLGQPGVSNLLGWIFLRKYEAGHRRDELKAHHDENLHTINLPLNEQYEGGGLFFIPGESSLGRAVVGMAGDNLEKYLKGGDVPDRCNTSDYFFPHTPVGKGTIYDKTVWHGVTRVTKGARYTLSFFYDEPKASTDDRITATFNNNVEASGDSGLYFVRAVDKVTDLEGNLLSPKDISLAPDDLVNLLRDGEDWDRGDSHEETTYLTHVFVAQHNNRIVKVWRITSKRGNNFSLEESDLRNSHEDL